jgi:hypothetical protein
MTDCIGSTASRLRANWLIKDTMELSPPGHRFDAHNFLWLCSGRVIYLLARGVLFSREKERSLKSLSSPTDICYPSRSWYYPVVSPRGMARGGISRSDTGKRSIAYLNGHPLVPGLPLVPRHKVCCGQGPPVVAVRV